MHCGDKASRHSAGCATVIWQGPELLGRSLPINCTSRPVRGLQSLSVVGGHDIQEKKNPSSSLYFKNLNYSNSDKICPFYMKIMTAMMDLNHLYV